MATNAGRLNPSGVAIRGRVLRAAPLAVGDRLSARHTCRVGAFTGSLGRSRGRIVVGTAPLTLGLLGGKVAAHDGASCARWTWTILRPIGVAAIGSFPRTTSVDYRQQRRWGKPVWPLLGRRSPRQRRVELAHLAPSPLRGLAPLGLLVVGRGFPPAPPPSGAGWPPRWTPLCREGWAGQREILGSTALRLGPWRSALAPRQPMVSGALPRLHQARERTLERSARTCDPVWRLPSQRSDCPASHAGGHWFIPSPSRLVARLRPRRLCQHRPRVSRRAVGSREARDRETDAPTPATERGAKRSSPAPGRGFPSPRAAAPGLCPARSPSPMCRRAGRAGRAHPARQSRPIGRVRRACRAPSRLPFPGTRSAGTPRRGP